MTALLTEHLATWIAADTTEKSARGRSKAASLYGVKKLRELILELAVRGLLVPQNLDDEPASELLKKIAAEKAKLVKEGKIKAQKPLPPIGDDEKPFELPKGWEWVRLGGIGIIGSSCRVHQKDWTHSGVPFYRAREIVKLSKDGFVHNELFITEELYQNLASGGTVPEVGDVMITGVGTIGIPYIVKDYDRFYFKDASVLIFKNKFNVFPLFLSHFFESPYWVKSIHADSMGTTVHTLTIVRANDVAVPLPPLAEQQRIVTKVDELMALCDQLEQQQNNSQTAHQHLVSQLLNALTQAANANDFQHTWQRIASHFDVLFTTEDSINQLKQSILQLAVMGKLVPQSPNDEPASQLLKKIATEKAKLVKEGKIKAQKPLPPIGDDEKPFELPQEWEWVRLGNLCRPVTSGSTPTGYFSETDGIPFLKVYNIRGQKVDFEYKKQFVDIDYHAAKMQRSIAYPNDVVMNIVGPPLGKVAIIPDTYPLWNCNQAIVVFSPIKPMLSKFIHLFICEGSFLKEIELIGTAGQDNISVTKSANMLFPLPSVAEQQSIVTKVDELMALCDQLKNQLNQAKHLQGKIADVLVEQALA